MCNVFGFVNYLQSSITNGDDASHHYILGLFVPHRQHTAA